MLPILLRAGPFTIYSFGVLLAISVVMASFLVWRQARKIGLSEEKVFDIFALAVSFGVIAARIGYVASHWNIFKVDLSRIFLFNHYAGLSFPFGFITGLIVILAGAKLFAMESLLVLDIFIFAFSWAFLLGLSGAVLDGSVGWQMVLPLFLVAIVLTLVRRQIQQKAVLVDLARRFGILSSSYLIFFTTSSLIMNRVARSEETILYLALLFGSIIVFMVKFPASVLRQIKDYLETKYRDAEKRLRDLKKEDPFEDNSRLLDRASDDSEAQSKAGHERVAALQQQLNLMLVQTRKALTKIKIGKYGICENCGKMIDTDRLSAMPTATLCLNCEKKRER